MTESKINIEPQFHNMFSSESHARRTSKVQSFNFQEFLEQTASELSDFGLTKTQAKIYITLVALGAASASNIAKSSKIRREEVYRIIPELEKHGMLTRNLEKPGKFSATQPETAIEILTKTKMKTMKEEVDKLKQKQDELMSKLKTVELPTVGLPIKHEDYSIEVISQRDNATAKLADMLKNANNQIDMIISPQNLQIASLDRPRKIMEAVPKSVKMRMIVEKCEFDAFTTHIVQFSEANSDSVELRQIEELPFNLLIVDDKEAMWGELQTKNENAQNLWTDNPTQIAILRMTFENLWQKSANTSTVNRRHSLLS